MEIVNSVFHYFTDRNIRFSNRFLLGFTIVLSLFIINDLLGFTFYHNTRHKVEHLEKVNTLLKDSTLRPEVRAKLLIIEKRILNRLNLWERGTRLVSGIGSPSDDSGPLDDIKQADRHVFWHILTSNLFLILLIVGLPFIVFDSKGWSIGKILAVIVMVEILLFFFAFIISSVFLALPILFGSPIYNYVLQAGLNIGLLIYFSWLGNRGK